MDSVTIRNIQRLLGQTEDGVLGSQTVEAMLSLVVDLVEEVELDEFHYPTERFEDIKRLAERVIDQL